MLLAAEIADHVGPLPRRNERNGARPLANREAFDRAEGQALVFFVMCVAAAEVAVGLAIIVVIFRMRQRLSVDDLSTMRW